MTVEPGLPLDPSKIRMIVAHMLSQNDWRLLDAEELTQRVLLSLASQPLTDGAHIASPEANNNPAPDDPPVRMWRRPVEGGRRQRRTADPAEAAMLQIYSATLYHAFAGQHDEERQQRAYHELLHYAYRVAARCEARLSRDEREEVAAHVLTELYCRYVANRERPDQSDGTLAGVFIAIALQLVRNTVRTWRSKIGPWVSLDISEEDGPAQTHIDELPDPAATFNPHVQAEQHEQRTQIAQAFEVAIRRYPRAKLQLHAVWLHLIEDLSYAKIADLLDTTISHVRVLTWRGLKRLNSDPGFRIHASDEQLLVGQIIAPREQSPVDQEREHGNG